MPTSLSELRSFIGMATGYIALFPKLATVFEPLHALEREDTQFVGSSECQVIFNVIKDSISSYVQSAPFDPRCRMLLTTDASDDELGDTPMELQASLQALHF